ncbi:hypothetical protein GYM96_02840 [Pseudomonas fragi]|uniref:hypothetical protein n=1 Tax=Pseudomonas fragi TaxID=296 RepID=UPI00193BD192|nr:hypothetical protein [Pseudomonas fragi]MBM1198714.1 hypothetical protein [Pseudomonas fragi]
MGLIDLYGDADSVSLLHYLSEEQKDLDKLARILIARLAKICAYPMLVERWSTVFSVHEDGTSADINTPFGQAWAELSLGIEEGEIGGFWNIWKRTYDKAGARASSLIATIHISKNGQFFLGKDKHQGLRIHPNMTEQEDTTAFQVVNSIIYLIGVNK